MSSFHDQIFSPLFWTEAAPQETTVAQDSGSSHFLDKRMRYVEIVASMCVIVFVTATRKVPGSNLGLATFAKSSMSSDEENWGLRIKAQICQ
jgi:hypothetical protein